MIPSCSYNNIFIEIVWSEPRLKLSQKWYNQSLNLEKSNQMNVSPGISTHFGYASTSQQENMSLRSRWSDIFQRMYVPSQLNSISVHNLCLQWLDSRCWRLPWTAPRPKRIWFSVWAIGLFPEGQEEFEGSALGGEKYLNRLLHTIWYIKGNSSKSFTYCALFLYKINWCTINLTHHLTIS